MPADPIRVREVFLAATELSPEQQPDYLADACLGDADLRAEVDRLLVANADPDSILESPPAAPTNITAVFDSDATSPTSIKPGRSLPVTGAETLTHVDPELSTSPGLATRSPLVAGASAGTWIGAVIAGRYTLVEVIGEGGMGSVYRASQSEPVKRQVALKLIKTGMNSREILARFDAERQALALMDHPNIARIYDGGVTDAGLPFFVMELINGIPITEYCDQKRLPVKARLELFVAACQAVQHAHQKGIIHRDLKPSNVLVTEVDGRPTPKVIDFGVAKATEMKLTDMSFADIGAIVGTPAYMSPEQADPSSMDIDTRTDVYALGVILYELLAGSPPLDAAQFRRGAILEMLRMVREVDPSRPSTKVGSAASLPSIAASRAIDPSQLKRTLTGDLDWIVMKAIEKNRDRRYETANGFAADILRHLASEPVLAAPPSQAYRMRKFVHKHRSGVVAASLVLGALVVGIIGTTWGLIRADLARKAEIVQRTRVEAREQQAIAAVKRFRDAVADNPELKSNPTLEPLRKVLLKEPLAFFKTLRDRLQADRDTRPESLARLARASSELGALSDEIGDKQDALIAYRESLAIFQALADSSPAVAEFRWDLAASHTSIGHLLRATGKPAEALEAHQAALAMLQTLADTNPTVTEFRRELSHCHFNIGLLLRDASKPAEALKAYEAALPMLQKLADSSPTVTEFRWDLAHCLLNIALALRDVGKLDETLKTYESALATLQKLADANPTVARFQSEMAHCHNNIGTGDSWTII